MLEYYNFNESKYYNFIQKYIFFGFFGKMLDSCWLCVLSMVESCKRYGAAVSYRQKIFDRVKQKVGPKRKTAHRFAGGRGRRTVVVVGIHVFVGRHVRARWISALTIVFVLFGASLFSFKYEITSTFVSSESSLSHRMLRAISTVITDKTINKISI